MRCEECGQSPVVSHQWRLCKDCHKEEMERLDAEIMKAADDKDYQLMLPLTNVTISDIDYLKTSAKRCERQAKLLEDADFAYIQARERSIFESTAEEIGRLVADKQKAYGDSFGKAGKILEILYPDGIALDQYDDVLTIARIVDKLFRIATDKDAMGESPWRDINGYSLLAYIRDQKRGKQ